MADRNWNDPAKREEYQRQLENERNLPPQQPLQPGRNPRRRGGGGGWWWFLFIIILIIICIWLIPWGGRGRNAVNNGLGSAAATSGTTANSTSTHNNATNNEAATRNTAGTNNTATAGSAANGGSVLNGTSAASEPGATGAGTQGSPELASVPQLLSRPQQFEGHKVVVPRAVVQQKLNNSALVVGPVETNGTQGNNGNETMTVVVPNTNATHNLQQGSQVEITGTVTAASQGEQGLNLSASQTRNVKNQGFYLRASAVTPLSQQNDNNGNGQQGGAVR